jgi:hypothetical protein
MLLAESEEEITLENKRSRLFDRIHLFNSVFNEKLNKIFKNPAKHILKISELIEEKRPQNRSGECYGKYKKRKCRKYDSHVAYIFDTIFRYDKIYDILEEIKTDHNYSYIEMYNVLCVTRIDLSDVNLKNIILFKNVDIPNTDINNITSNLKLMLAKYYDFNFFLSDYDRYFNNNNPIQHSPEYQYLIYYCKELTLILDKIKVFKTKKQDDSFRKLSEEIPYITEDSKLSDSFREIRELSRLSHKSSYLSGKYYTITKDSDEYNCNTLKANYKSCKIKLDKFDMIYDTSIKILKKYTEDLDKMDKKIIGYYAAQ